MAAPRSRGRNTPQPTPAWVPGAVVTLTSLLGLVAVYFGFPGFVLVWAGLIVGSWSAMPPEITGRDPNTKNPIPQGPLEQKKFQRFQFWRALKWGLIFPAASVWPGWPLRASFLGSLLAAAVAYALPAYRLPAEYPSWALSAINALFAFIVVGQVAAARRDTLVPGDRCPGVRLDALRDVPKIVTGPAVLLGLVCAGLVYALVPAPSHIPSLPVSVSGSLVVTPALLLAAFLLARPLRKAATSLITRVGHIDALARLVGPIDAAWTKVRTLASKALSVLPIPEAVTTFVPRLLFAAAATLIARTFVPVPDLPSVPGNALASATWPLVAFAVAFAAVAGKSWVDASLEHWRMVCAAREEWTPRWIMLKHQSAPPRLTNREILDQAVIDTFIGDGMMGGSAGYLSLGSKILPTMGRPVKLAVLPNPSKDSQGQPMPGTVDPNEFRIVTWPGDIQFSLADPAVNPDVARLWLDCALAWVCEGMYEPPSVDEFVSIAVASEPEPTYVIDPETGSPAVDEETGEPIIDPTAPLPAATLTAGAFAVTLHRGPGYEIFRRELIGSLTGWCQCEALADHRKGVLYLGTLTDDAPELDPECGVTHQDLLNLDTEDAWNRRWKAVLKQDVNPPTIDHRTYAEFPIPLGNGAAAVIKRQAFVPRQGVDLRDFFGLEAKIAATMTGAPFVVVTGWTSSTPGRAGERHAQAFQVVWANQAVPANPDTLKPLSVTSPRRPEPRAARPTGPVGPQGGRDPRDPRDPRGPQGGPDPRDPRDPRAGRAPNPRDARRGPGNEMPGHNDGHVLLLGGRITHAFKAARLAQPEVYRVRCLTSPSSPGHIWAMHVRLYDGVTLADVRGAAQRLRQALGSQWLRVEEAPDGCVIVAGASPSKVRLADPAKDQRYLASLDWEQAFLDAKVHGVGAKTPFLTEVSHLPKNEKVQVLTFDLPSGLDLPTLKGASKKLETATSNAFVEVRRGPSGRSDEATILACEVPPMPETAPFDWAEADANGHKVPFATGLTGEATTFDNRLDPHLLISGQSGSGKSVALQNVIYGALVRDWDLWVIDPSKGGVDFQFSEPWAKAFGRTVWEAKGIIEAIYAEVLRRKAINAQYNCGNYRDLPDEVRYPHVLIVMDEFTSMMMPEPVAKAATDDPDVLAGIAQTQALNAARAYIGTYTGKIVREARSTGFTMLLATQALKADTLQKIPGANDLKDNMSRMIVGRASFGQLAAALKMPQDAPPQPEVLPPGRGLYEGNGRPAEAIQVWFEGSQQAFSEQVAQRRAPLPLSEKLDVSGFVEPELEVDGGIIEGEPMPLQDADEPSFAPSLEALEQVVVEEVSFSLDDLSAFIDDDEADSTTASHSPTAASAPAFAAAYADTSSLPEVETDAVAPTFDWDAAEAAAADLDVPVAGPLPSAEQFAAQFTGLPEQPTPDATDGPEPEGSEQPDAAPAFDWDAAEAAAADLTAAFADDAGGTTSEADDESLDWGTSGTAQDPGSGLETDPDAEPGTVEVLDSVDFSEVDPSPWEPAVSEFGWSEIDALLGFLDAAPAVRTVTWDDPKLLEVDITGITFGDLVEELLCERGVAFDGPAAPEEPEAPERATASVAETPAEQHEQQAPVADVAAQVPAPQPSDVPSPATQHQPPTPPPAPPAAPAPVLVPATLPDEEFDNRQPVRAQFVLNVDEFD